MVPGRSVALRQRLDRIDQRVAGLDVHAGGAIGQGRRRGTGQGGLRSAIGWHGSAARRGAGCWSASAGQRGGDAMPVRSCSARARGKNHVAAMIATALLVLAPIAASRAQNDPALSGLSADPAVPSAPAAINFTQRGVPAEATAENGVVARERALANGRRAAWERIASSAGVTRSLTDAQIESMVSSIIIEEERTSPTRYTGRITVNFNPGRARSYTGGGGVAEGGGPGGGGSTTGDASAERRPQGPVPAAATVEVVALYGSLGEWLELRRRLTGRGRADRHRRHLDRPRQAARRPALPARGGGRGTRRPGDHHDPGLRSAGRCLARGPCRTLLTGYAGRRRRPRSMSRQGCSPCPTSSPLPGFVPCRRRCG